MGSKYTKPGVSNADSNNWDSTFTTVNSTSANWSGTSTTVNSNSANWDSTFTTVGSNSATWAAGGGSAGLWVSGFDGVNTTATLSSQFDIAYAPSISASETIYSENMNVSGTLTIEDLIYNATTVQSVTSTGMFATLTVNGSALAIPLYIY